jgi:hypothetical protein
MGVTLRCGVFVGGGPRRAGQTGGNFAGRRGPEAIWLVPAISIIGVLCFPI